MREGWKIKRLKEVCEIVAGQSPQGKFYNKTGDGLPFYQGKKEFGEKYIGPPTTWTSKVTKIAIAGDILLSVRAPVGPVNFGTEKICIGRGLAAIRASENIDKEFLFYFLLFNKSKLTGSSGAVFNSINKTQIGNIEFPLPGLDEQQQIVNILDEAFSSIDKAKANLEQNLANAQELFQSKLDAIFSQRGEGWEEKKLGEACDINMGQSPRGTTYNSDGKGTPLINGPVEFGKKPFDATLMTKWTTEPTKMCEKDDLILCVRGSTTGRINLAGFQACIGRGVASIRYSQNQEWLNFFIRSRQKEIYKLGSGATFPNVSGKTLGEMSFPEPPIEEQKALVDMMHQLEKKTSLLQEKFSRRLLILEELKKALLQKAFSGELINKQEPEPL